jgi:hypothetical protein
VRGIDEDASRLEDNGRDLNMIVEEELFLEEVY